MTHRDFKKTLFSFHSVGGNISQHVENNITYQIHTFLSLGVFEINKTTYVDTLVVAGGGSGIIIIRYVL